MNQQVIATDVHIAFAKDGNTAASSPNNHFFEYQQGGQIYSSSFYSASGLMRVRVKYYSGVSEYQPIIIIARHIPKDYQEFLNTIRSLDTLKFISKYEVTHFGGKFQDGTITIELLLTPGYAYRFITDSDMAISFIEGGQLTLPTK